MRMLVAVLFACATSTCTFAADKDEDKAREVTVSFLKAWKAKDIDAVMKTVGVPFVVEDRREVKVIEKIEEVKAFMKTEIARLKNTDPIPVKAGELTDLSALRKEFAKKPDLLKAYEKVLGEKGYAVVVGMENEGDGAVLVRIKDGKAVVVGIPR